MKKPGSSGLFLLGLTLNETNHYILDNRTDPMHSHAGNCNVPVCIGLDNRIDLVGYLHHPNLRIKAQTVGRMPSGDPPF
jgi:hypothetical protein